MTQTQGFPPIVTPASRVLVLGTMPGVASVKAGQYYAHPRNLFWPMAAEIFQFDPRAPYESRVGLLQAAGVALWDVLESVWRPGSLDARIDTRTAKANDFNAFFDNYPSILRVCFNGRTAHALYVRKVVPALRGTLEKECVVLPSTSPANTTATRTDKLRQWRAALTVPNDASRP
ncbi:MAG: DNA-deoxyinosine glycosylase [Gemmatimonadaceae bacterium]